MTINILIADDHDQVHQQVKFLLSSEENFQLIGAAKTGQEALQMARALRPDMVLMDIRMPGMNGIEAACQLKTEMPKLKVLFLTNYDLEIYRDVAKACGASAYILKGSMFNSLIPAIQEISKTGGLNVFLNPD